MGYWTYALHRLRYVSFPQLIIDILAKAGVYLQPYFLFLERMADEGTLKWGTLPPGYTIGFLNSEDMRLIAALPEKNTPEHVLKERLKNGNLCLGVKYYGDLAAFTWCNLVYCSFPGDVLIMNEDEAYLFDAHTATPYRGKGLAPIARYQLYLELARMGKIKLYSFSEMFNTPAIRFKQKLDSKIIYKGIYMRLFHKWHFRFKRKV
jgi:hypothetical protein